MGWFLYDNGLRLERVKSVIYTSKQFVMLLQVELTGCAIVILPQKKTLHFLLQCQQYQTIRLEFP